MTDGSPTDVPGGAFGETPLGARDLDFGMGMAIARRTVFRPEDREDFGRVAARVAEGNMSLLGRKPGAADRAEQARLRNAIATGALLTSGRHLQHGDAGQAARAMELFTNCATAIATFTEFYLLLNGAGVGRAYDDALVVVDWADAPQLLLQLSPTHPDYPRDADGLASFAAEFGLSLAEGARAFLDRELLAEGAALPEGALRHVVGDSREGWAKAVEILEAMTFRRERDRTLVLDFSAIRPTGAPIRGMEGRPAPGPRSLLRAFVGLRANVIAPSRADAVPPWVQALRADHCLSVEAQAGGARHAARMATKDWRDPGAAAFASLKSHEGLWTANHSLMVDREFWRRVADARAGRDLADPLTRHALAVFEDATRCAWATGEPGFLNADLLEDNRTGSARRKPANADGRDVCSRRYQADAAASLLAELSHRAATVRFPATTNPCGEVVLHVTGGYCVVGDFAPLLACPVPLNAVMPGKPLPDIAAQWDARVEGAVRLGVRFLMRVNLMDALYGPEVLRTNRIGIGPTGLHEWAWLRFGLDFRDLLDERRSAPFWGQLAQLSAVAKQEALRYAAALGRPPPLTVTTIKPAGTTSKLFGLSEGAHLPAHRHYLRWVQFRGWRDAQGRWMPQSDPLLAEFAARGYPVRGLRSIPGVSVVGFPTSPLLWRLGLGSRLVTAAEATPEEHYGWLRLLERHWIGAERGNQVSYTLRLDTSHFDLEAFRELLLREQPTVRGCTVMPAAPSEAGAYEYLPEEEVSPSELSALLAGITDPGLHEAVELAGLECALCPS